ncbi:hypothetical protein GCM10010231_34440 [Streptomyces sindenensis]|nr:hypothetical protein GCM10010231_34440 [Streptomyces sindenensis]
MGDVRGDVPVRGVDHGPQATAPPLLDARGLDVHHLLPAERMLGPEPDGAPDDVMRIVGGEALLVHRHLRIHELLQRDEVGPGADQRAGGPVGIPVLVADVVLHDDKLPPAAALLAGQEQPAEGVHPHAHRQQEGNEGDGGPPNEGDDQQDDDEEPDPGQKGLQQAPHPPRPVGNMPVKPQDDPHDHGTPGDHPPPSLPHPRRRRLRRHRTAVCPLHHVFPSTRPCSVGRADGRISFRTARVPGLAAGHDG